MAESHHLVSFLCNDEHGLPEGHVGAVEILDEIRLACPSNRPPVFRVFDEQIQVGRIRYPHLGWQSCVGNIFWDAGKMHVADARRLIRDLLARGWVVEEHAESGPFAHLVGRPAPGWTREEGR